MTEDQVIITSILDCKLSDLYTGRCGLSSFQQEEFLEKKNRRLSGYPLQYITGDTEFFGLRFKVDPRVLVPRPETERLIEEALALLKNEYSGKPVSVLDIGTGCGCIAVALAVFCPLARVYACDISPEALEVARQNSGFHRLDQRITFFQADIFPETPQKYDLIISNPPYIASSQIELLPKDVKHEPRLAFDGGSDGLEFYRRIFSRADQFLKEGGFIMLEAGCGQSDELRDILEETKRFKVTKVIMDYNDIERAMIVRLVG